MEPADSFSSMWDISSYDEYSPAELQPNVSDDIDEEFLMMVDEDDDNAAVGLLDDEDMSGINYGSSVLPSYNDAADLSSTESDTYMDYVHAVTPEHALSQDIAPTANHAATPDPKKDIDDIRVPDMQELRMQYNEALKKLAESMRRSEVARHQIACRGLAANSSATDIHIFAGATEFFFWISGNYYDRIGGISTTALVLHKFSQ